MLRVTQNPLPAHSPVSETKLWGWESFPFMSIFYLISKLRNIKIFFFFLMFGNFMFFFCFSLTIDKCPLLPLGPGWDNVLESRTESSPVPPPAAPLRPTLPAGWPSFLLYLPLWKRTPGTSVCPEDRWASATCSQRPVDRWGTSSCLPERKRIDHR